MIDRRLFQRLIAVVSLGVASVVAFSQTGHSAFGLKVEAEHTGAPAYDRTVWSESWTKQVNEALGWETRTCKWAFYASTERDCLTEPNRDHLMEVGEAHRSGGWKWDREQRRDFYLDIDNLWVMSRWENDKKSDDDPAVWLPANPDQHCEYVTHWVRTKQKWNLSADPAEVAAIQNIPDCSPAETVG